MAEYCFARSIPTDWFGKDILTDSNMKELMVYSSRRYTEWLIIEGYPFDILIMDLYDEIVYLLERL